MLIQQQVSLSHSLTRSLLLSSLFRPSRWVYSLVGGLRIGKHAVKPESLVGSGRAQPKPYSRRPMRNPRTIDTHSTAARNFRRNAIGTVVLGGERDAFPRKRGPAGSISPFATLNPKLLNPKPVHRGKESREHG